MKLTPKTIPSLDITELDGIVAITNEEGRTWFVPGRHWPTITAADEPYEAALSPPVSWTLIKPEFVDKIFTDGLQAHYGYNDAGNYIFAYDDDAIDLAKLDLKTAVFLDSYDHTFWRVGEEHPISVPTDVEFWGTYWDLEGLKVGLEGNPLVKNFEIESNNVSQNWEISGRRLGKGIIHLPQDVYEKLNELSRQHDRSYRDGVPANFYNSSLRDMVNFGANKVQREAGFEDVLSINIFRKDEKEREHEQSRGYDESQDYYDY